MKSYGKRFLKNRMNEMVMQRTETRNAVVWNVYPANKYCEVKIQGSNELIRAYYPIGWEKTPSYVKKGGCVLIAHTGGNRGRIEVAGMGILIPSAISGDDLPDQPTPADTIISGLNVMQIPNGSWMRVYVTTGYVRFSGTTTFRDAITMGEAGDNMPMSMWIPIDICAGICLIAAAPAVGLYRYDLIVIGSDLAFDVVQGTASATPAFPSVPSGHLQCGWVLVYGGMTQILQSDINRSFAASKGSQLVITISDDDLAWAELTSLVTVAMKNQYGNPYSILGLGFYFTLEIIQGNGTISYGSYSSTTSLSVHSYLSDQIIFTYTRDQLDPGDSSPTFRATVDGYIFTATDNIVLRDASGNPMY